VPKIATIYSSLAVPYTHWHAKKQNAMIGDSTGLVAHNKQQGWGACLSLSYTILVLLPNFVILLCLGRVNRHRFAKCKETGVQVR